jgi:hypothetical protein
MLRKCPYKFALGNFAMKKAALLRYTPSKVKRTIDSSIEAPPVHYCITAAELIAALSETKIKDRDSILDLLNALQGYEVHSIIPKPIRKEKESGNSVMKTKPAFKEKQVKALFVLESGEYKYFDILIAPSNIKEAGYGAYALEEIPKGARGFYKGIPRRGKDVNPYYSWTVKTFDDDGDQDARDLPLYYVDAEDEKFANWTRYVNCGPTAKSNNMEPDQHFGTFWYVATRTIKALSELFIDYGIRYRVENLKMDADVY